MKYESDFIVFPKHCNHLYPLIFGGAFLEEMDLCAAKCVRMALLDSKLSYAVTHKIEGVEFMAPCYSGDWIHLQSHVISLGSKSVVVELQAFRQKKQMRELVAKAKFVFITINDPKDLETRPRFLPYADHGLHLDGGD